MLRLRSALQDKKRHTGWPGFLLDHSRGPQTVGRHSQNQFRIYALFSLRGTLVCLGMSHRRHAKAGQGWDRIRGCGFVCRLQILHYGLSLGYAAMESGDRKSI